MFQNLKAMPGILKWLTALTLVPPLFVLCTLIPNGSVKVYGSPMTNSAWWSCGAGVVVALLAVMMVVAEILLLQRSKYSRPVFLIAMASTMLSGLPLEQLLEPKVTPPLWPTVFDLIPIALMTWYLYASKAVQTYFHPKSFP